MNINAQKSIVNSITFDENSFFEGILKDEYVLVLGSGIILDREKFPDSKGDINKYILSEINKEQNFNYDTLSDAVHNSNTPLLYDWFINKLEYKIEDISPELRNLLKTKCFKFVFTTTPDHYTEALMRAIWGNELRIVNISSHISLEKFYNEIKETSIEKYNVPTLFYVFGKARKGQINPPQFLQTDNDAISYIEKWLKFEEDNYLVGFLRKKRLIGIGCNFDDWYYRFFWFILTRDFIPREKYSPYRYDNAIIESKSNGLNNYLNKLSVCLHNDPWTLMNHMTHRLKDTSDEVSFRDLIMKRIMEGKIFISYKTDPDKKTTGKLYELLKERNSFKLWFDDSSLLGGQPYNLKIPEAIRFSQVFIPVLTASVAEVLNNISLENLNNLDYNNGLPYFIQEWKWAANVPGLEIIPISFEGYDLQSEAHRKFNNLIFNSEEEVASVVYMGNPETIEITDIEKLEISIYNALNL